MNKDIAKNQFFAISTRGEDRFFLGGGEAREPSDWVISQSSDKQAYVRKFNPATYAECKRFDGCTERNALIGLYINHIIILSPVTRVSSRGYKDMSLDVKVKQSHYRPGVAQRVLTKLRFPDFVTTAQDGGKAVSLTHRPLLPQEIFLVLISVRCWVDPRAIVRS